MDKNEELVDVARRVAMAAPSTRRLDGAVFATKIPWDMIDELRATLDGCGVEWRPRSRK